MPDFEPASTPDCRLVINSSTSFRSDLSKLKAMKSKTALRGSATDTNIERNDKPNVSSDAAVNSRGCDSQKLDLDSIKDLRRTLTTQSSGSMSSIRGNCAMSRARKLAMNDGGSLGQNSVRSS